MKIMKIIAITITVYLLLNFDIWFMYVIHFIEQRITDNGARIYAAMPSILIAFLFSFIFCFLPMIVIGMIIESYTIFNLKGRNEQK
jgi:hypothetical protein